MAFGETAEQMMRRLAEQRARFPLLANDSVRPVDVFRVDALRRSEGRPLSPISLAAIQTINVARRIDTQEMTRRALESDEEALGASRGAPIDPLRPEPGPVTWGTAGGRSTNFQAPSFARNFEAATDPAVRAVVEGKAPRYGNAEGVGETPIEQARNLARNIGRLGGGILGAEANRLEEGLQSIPLARILRGEGVGAALKPALPPEPERSNREVVADFGEGLARGVNGRSFLERQLREVTDGQVGLADIGLDEKELPRLGNEIINALSPLNFVTGLTGGAAATALRSQALKMAPGPARVAVRVAANLVEPFFKGGAGQAIGREVAADVAAQEAFAAVPEGAAGFGAFEVGEQRIEPVRFASGAVAALLTGYSPEITRSLGRAFSGVDDAVLRDAFKLPPIRGGAELPTSEETRLVRAGLAAKGWAEVPAQQAQWFLPDGTGVAKPHAFSNVDANFNTPHVFAALDLGLVDRPATFGVENEINAALAERGWVRRSAVGHYDVWKVNPRSAAIVEDALLSEPPGPANAALYVNELSTGMVTRFTRQDFEAANFSLGQVLRENRGRGGIPQDPIVPASLRSMIPDPELGPGGTPVQAGMPGFAENVPTLRPENAPVEQQGAFMGMPAPQAPARPQLPGQSSIFDVPGVEAAPPRELAMQAALQGNSPEERLRALFKAVPNANETNPSAIRAAITGNDVNPFSDANIRAHNGWLDTFERKYKVPDSTYDDLQRRFGGGEVKPRTTFPEPDEALIAEARKEFGTTANFEAAGYIMPDGRMLNFAEAGGDGTRSLDHRAVDRLAGLEGTVPDGSGTSGPAMIAFQERAHAIRWMPEANGADIAQPPTDAQLRRLTSRIKEGPLLVDLTDPSTGRTLASAEVTNVRELRKLLEENGYGPQRRVAGGSVDSEGLAAAIPQTIDVNPAELGMRPDLFQLRDVAPGQPVDPRRVAQIASNFEPGRFEAIDVARATTDAPELGIAAGDLIVYSGHHRTVAAQQLGLERIPARITDVDFNDPGALKQVRQEAIIRNQTTAPLNFEERVRAYQELEDTGLETSEISAAMRTTRGQVERHLDIGRVGQAAVERINANPALEPAGAAVGRGVRLYGIDRETAMALFDRFTRVGEGGTLPGIQVINKTIDELAPEFAQGSLGGFGRSELVAAADEALRLRAQMSTEAARLAGDLRGAARAAEAGVEGIDAARVAESGERIMAQLKERLATVEAGIRTRGISQDASAAPRFGDVPPEITQGGPGLFDAEPAPARPFSAVEGAQTGQPLTVTGYREGGPGSFYAADPQLAEQYRAGRPSNLITQELSFENPLVAPYKDDLLRAWQDDASLPEGVRQGARELLDSLEGRGPPLAAGAPDRFIEEQAKALGHDGIVFRDATTPAVAAGIDATPAANYTEIVDLRGGVSRETLAARAALAEPGPDVTAQMQPLELTDIDEIARMAGLDPDVAAAEVHRAVQEGRIPYPTVARGEPDPLPGSRGARQATLTGGSAPPQPAPPLGAPGELRAAPALPGQQGLSSEFVPPGMPPGTRNRLDFREGEPNIDDLLIPGRDPGNELLRVHTGRLSAFGNQTLRDLEQSNAVLEQAGLGSKFGDRLAVDPNEPGIRALWRALHNPSDVESGALVVPDRLKPAYERLREVTDWETAATLDFDPEFATTEDYFYRGWRNIELTAEETAAAKGGAASMAGTPRFAKPRVNAGFDELVGRVFQRENGTLYRLEPISWNPAEQAAVRTLLGQQYREQVRVINWLRAKDVAVPVDGALLKGYQVPNLGPAFEGRGFPLPDGGRAHIGQFQVPNNVADVLDTMYGGPASLRIAGDFDVAHFIESWGGRLKQTKVYASLFQQVDFSIRNGASSFGAAINDLRQGRPFEAVQDVITVPRDMANLLRSNISPRFRQELKDRMLSSEPLLGRNFDPTDTRVPQISAKSIIEAGWDPTDPSMFMRDIRSTLEEYGKRNGVSEGVIRERVRQASAAWSKGLFEGVYPQAQLISLEKQIVPRLLREHPTWTAQQIAGAAARRVNLQYSTMPVWQSVFKSKNGRALLRGLFFSTNESEALLTQAFGTIKGEDAGFWRETYGGAALFIGILANLVHFAATGEELPLDRYVPVKKDPYSPLGVGYNNEFLSPDIPFIKGRNGLPVQLDLVGQMDTAFRVLDGWGFIAARANVLPRTVLNQARSSDFYGRKFENVGERVTQLASDLFAPIGVGSVLGAAREGSAALRAVLPENEGRLGAIGQLVQASGLNLRAQTTPDALDAAARAWSKAQPGGTERGWQDLEPAEKKLAVPEGLEAELNQRRDTAAERGDEGAIKGGLFADVTAERVGGEARLGEKIATRQIGGEAIRGEYNALQEAAALKRAGIDKAMPSEERERPEDPNEAALWDYYSVYRRAGEAGLVEGDRYDFQDAELAKLEGIWTPEQKAYVERNTGLSEHHESMDELADTREQLEQTGFWAYNERIWATLQAQAPPEFNLQLYPDYYAWKGAQLTELRKVADSYGLGTGVAEDAVNRMVAGHAVAKAWTANKTWAKSDWMNANAGTPDLIDRAVFYGYLNPSTDDAARLQGLLSGTGAGGQVPASSTAPTQAGVRPLDAGTRPLESRPLAPAR